MGQPGYNLSATAYSQLPTGFDAIAVALLGNTSSIGIVISALFLGGLRSGSTEMQAVAHIDPNLVFIIEALVLFFIAAEFIPVISRHLPVWMRTKRPIATTLASATSGLPVPVVSEEDSGIAEENGEDAPQNGDERDTQQDYSSANPGKEQ